MLDDALADPATPEDVQIISGGGLTSTFGRGTVGALRATPGREGRAGLPSGTRGDATARPGLPADRNLPRSAAHRPSGTPERGRPVGL